MLTEKRLFSVPPQSLTSDGGSDGEINIADTAEFKVGRVCVLKSDTQQPLRVQVKRVVSPTRLFVGDPSQPIQDRIDVSAYLVADNATIESHEQNRSTVPQQEIERITYDGEPSVARRVVLVDPYGDKYTTQNPLPVQLSTGSINIDTVQGDLSVHLTHEDDSPESGDVHDSVRIGDGEDQLQVNDDGSINVKRVPGSAGDFKSLFFEVSSVASGVQTNIASYTVPGTATKAVMHLIEVGGSNVALYEVLVNGVINARKRIYFGGSFSDQFDYSLGGGLDLSPGDTIDVRVLHNRPSVGDFETRLQLVEV